MQIFVEMWQFPFMQRAFIAGAVLGVLLAALGVLATLRKMAFFGEGVAHASLAGIALALLAGFAPLPVALLWAVAVAVIIFWLERFTRLPSDTVIGILFTASMAAGVILMSLTQGYQPELMTYLFGSILTITATDLLIIGFLAAIILFWYGLFLRQLTFLSLSEESAHVAGINTTLHTLLFYISLAVATVLGVKILGIILVSALIVLPPATSRTLTSSFKQYLIVTVLIAEVSILAGLTISFMYDLPSGAVIVLVATGCFLLATLLRTLRLSPSAR